MTHERDNSTLPAVMDDLIATIKYHLEQQKVINPEQISENIAMAFFSANKGFTIYIPSDRRLQVAQRNRQIIKQYNAGMECAELAKRFGLSTSRVRWVIRKAGRV